MKNLTFLRLAMTTRVPTREAGLAFCFLARLARPQDPSAIAQDLVVVVRVDERLIETGWRPRRRLLWLLLFRKRRRCNFNGRYIHHPMQSAEQCDENGEQREDDGEVL